jgi:hypothetical protein
VKLPTCFACVSASGAHPYADYQRCPTCGFFRRRDAAPKLGALLPPVLRGVRARRIVRGGAA